LGVHDHGRRRGRRVDDRGRGRVVVVVYMHAVAVDPDAVLVVVVPVARVVSWGDVRHGERGRRLGTVRASTWARFLLAEISVIA